jgi:excisionase family DNA binding protein
MVAGKPDAAALPIPPEWLDALADLVADKLADRLPAAPEPSPYMTTAEAAAYLCCKPQRVHDLLSAGRLTRHKDGRRTLIARADLEAHLAKETRR